MKDFLITGATGQLGHGIVKQLLKRVPEKSIAVLVRDPSPRARLRHMASRFDRETIKTWRRSNPLSRASTS